MIWVMHFFKKRKEKGEEPLTPKASRVDDDAFWDLRDPHHTHTHTRTIQKSIKPLATHTKTTNFEISKIL